MNRLQTLEMALEALESCTPADTSTGHVMWPSYDEQAVEQAIAALRTQIALEKMAENERELGIQMQPDEPVAYSVTWDDVHCGNFFFREQDAKEHKARLDTKYPGEHRKIVPLYTLPQPAAQWVDLDDNEMLMIYCQDHKDKKYSLGRMVQQALKAKNT